MRAAREILRAVAMAAGAREIASHVTLQIHELDRHGQPGATVEIPGGTVSARGGCHRTARAGSPGTALARGSGIPRGARSISGWESSPPGDSAHGARSWSLGSRTRPSPSAWHGSRSGQRGSWEASRTPRASAPPPWPWASVARSLGIDTETCTDVKRDLWPSICTPDESAWLDTVPAARHVAAAALIFSAKEAFYKSQYPLTGEFWDFRTLRCSRTHAARPRERLAAGVRSHRAAPSRAALLRRERTARSRSHRCRGGRRSGRPGLRSGRRSAPHPAPRPSSSTSA